MINVKGIYYFVAMVTRQRTIMFNGKWKFASCHGCHSMEYVSNEFQGRPSISRMLLQKSLTSFTCDKSDDTWLFGLAHWSQDKCAAITLLWQTSLFNNSWTEYEFMDDKVKRMSLPSRKTNTIMSYTYRLNNLSWEVESSRIYGFIQREDLILNLWTFFSLLIYLTNASDLRLKLELDSSRSEEV